MTIFGKAASYLESFIQFDRGLISALMPVFEFGSERLSHIVWCFSFCGNARLVACHSLMVFWV